MVASIRDPLWLSVALWQELDVSSQSTATCIGSERDPSLCSSYEMTVALADIRRFTSLWETLTKSTWQSHTWIPGPQKLRGNKCLLFQKAILWNNLLHSNRYLISLSLYLCNPPSSLINLLPMHDFVILCIGFLKIFVHWVMQTFQILTISSYTILF